MRLGSLASMVMGAWLLLQLLWVGGCDAGPQRLPQRVQSTADYMRMVQTKQGGVGEVKAASGVAEIVEMLQKDLSAQDYDTAGIDALLDKLDVVASSLDNIDSDFVDGLLELQAAPELDFASFVLRKEPHDKLLEVWARVQSAVGDNQKAMSKHMSALRGHGLVVYKDLTKLLDGFPRRSLRDQNTADQYTEMIAQTLVLTDVRERCRRAHYEASCNKNTCQNGGKCLPGLSDHHCACLTGWEGDDCSHNSNDCEDNPCDNGGTCVDGVGSFVCQCVQGFVGETCAYNINECLEGLCENGATCVDGDNGFKCECVAGFSGELCDKEHDACDPNPCENDGECTNLRVDFECACVPGFSGKTCATNDDDCDPNPCYNGGVCTDGVNDFTCKCADGWQGKECTQDIDDCAAEPCKNGGQCLDQVNGYRCVCPEGFEGAQCEENVDECATLNPCENGATCHDGIASYTCDCAPGFTGVTCDIDINECLSHPCENGATCYDKVNGVECVCPAGFEGDNCEINIDECADDPCAHGSCSDGINRFHCACDDGWEGDKCDENIDECKPDPCLNGGTCVDGIASFQCVCKPGFAGARCESNKDECAGNPCKNGGECLDGINSYLCHCALGFEGTDCEINIDDCKGDPCKNGKCVDMINKYRCECPAGWEGPKCDININECLQEPCMNGGVCADGIGTYTCKCKAGYSGARCETNIDECSPDPCKNGAKCVDGINSYVCQCPRGYEGKDCETVSDMCVVDKVHCENDGRCVSGVGTWKCECPKGYVGKLCQSNFDECAADPCKNGGKCYDGINSYVCECKAGYVGKNCETMIDFCERDKPCKSYAKCRPIPNDFRCICPNGYSGKRCETSPYRSISTSTTWTKEQEYCASQGKSLCSLRELCPNGAGKSPKYPAFNGDKMVAIASADYLNSWVVLNGGKGGEKATCQSYRAAYGKFAELGMKSSSWEARPHGLCCSSGCSSSELSNPGYYKATGVTYTRDGQTCDLWNHRNTNQPMSHRNVRRKMHFNQYGPLARSTGSTTWGCITPSGWRPAVPKCGPLNVCESKNPCKFGGSCQVANNRAGYSCKCPSGYSGDNCQYSSYEYSLHNSAWCYRCTRENNFDIFVYYHGYYTFTRHISRPVSTVLDIKLHSDECVWLYGMASPGYWGNYAMQFLINGWGRYTWGNYYSVHGYGRGYQIPEIYRYQLYRQDRYDYYGVFYVNTRHINSVYMGNGWTNGYFGGGRSCVHYSIRRAYFISSFNKNAQHPMHAMLNERANSNYLS